MTDSGTWAAIAVAALLVGGWTTWSLRRLHSEHPAGDAGPPAAQLRLLPHRAGDFGSALTVTDRDGRPLAGATVRRTRRGVRAVQAEGHPVIAVTDGDGRAAASGDWLGGDPGDQLLVHAAGMVAAAVPLPLPSDAAVELRLQPGHPLRVCCRRADGSPAPDMRLALTAAPGGCGVSPAGVLPGGDPATAVHLATTDADGELEFHGVAAGRAILTLLHDTCAIVAGMRGPTIAVPHAPLELTVEELVGRIVAPPAAGGRVLAWSFRGQLAAPPGRSMTLALPSLTRANSRLRAAHPGSAVLVQMARPGLPALDFVALLEGHGWVRAPLELVPLSQIEARPLVLSAAGAPAAHGTLIVHGPPNSARHPLALRTQHDGIDCEIPIRIGDSVRLPQGIYALIGTDPVTLRAQPPRRVELRGGAVNELSYEVPGHHPARIVFAGGDRADGVEVQLRRGGEVLLRTAARTDEPRLWLPDGELDLVIAGTGRPPIARHVRVPDDLDHGVLTVEESP